MRRAAVVVLCAGAALFPLAAGASAIGPGGWDHVGLGATTSLPSLNGAVLAMSTARAGTLLVGGSFTSAGGAGGTARIASWNGSTWSGLGTGGITNGAVFTITAHDSRIFAGGTFLDAGGNSNADHLAVWNGSSWAPFCTNTGVGPSFGGNVQALQIIGNTLYVGGSFQNGAGIAAGDYLVACDLTTGAASAVVPTDGGINAGVMALTADSNGVLYVGGQFINLAGIAAADHIAAYDGSWHALGSGGGSGGGAVDSYVRALAASGTNVYIGTDSVDVAGIPQADHVARWNGSSWSALGHDTAGSGGWFPTTAFIYAMATYGSLVFVGGSFQNANGVATADEIAFFDGTTWRPIGSNGAGDGPIGSNLTALGVFSSKAYAGGAFTSAGGDTKAQYIAAYGLRLPDARIATASTGPWTGNNVYSTTGSGESKTRYITRGTSGNFYVSLQNDGLVATSFTILGTGSASGYTVSYYRGTLNITTAVKAGTYSTGSIARGSVVTIRVLVHLSTSAVTSATYRITMKSVTGTPSDAVRAIAHAQ